MMLYTRRPSRAAYLRDGIHTAHPARLAVFCNNVFSDGANPNGKMRLPLLILLRLDVNRLRSDPDHDAFALWVLSSSERAVTGVAAFWGWSRQDSNL